MGTSFGAGLFSCEVDYLVQHEWARTRDDILWRRTKLGLHLTSAQTDELDRYLALNLDQLLTNH